MYTETDALQFWRDVDAELKLLHEPPSDFGDNTGYVRSAADAREAAKRIRELRIKAYHAEEGDNI